jgi:hypothetical protein
MKRPIVALAVSGHGFGHAVRCAEVARELLGQGARVLVRTDAPRWLFPDRVEHVPSPGWPLDIGVAQHDGLELDVDETRRRWQSFGREFEQHVQGEAQLLRQHGVDILLGDIPPLAFAAAARAHVPALAQANFGWDWIYAAWPDFEAAISQVRGGYAQADRLLRLPLHSSDADAFPAFANVEDVPLIARRAQRSRSDVRTSIGVADNALLVLLSFGAFSASGLNIAALGEWTSYLFLVTPPLSDGLAEPPANVLALHETPADYVSLLAACDVVVTKPGYGIVADTLANQGAMLYTERGPFREYDVLVRALPSLFRARYVPHAELLAGYLGPHLDALLGMPAPVPEVRTDGALVVTERVLAHCVQAPLQRAVGRAAVDP